MKTILLLPFLAMALTTVSSAAIVFTGEDNYSLSSPTVLTDAGLSSLIKGGTTPGTGTIMMWVNFDSLPTSGLTLLSVEAVTGSGGTGYSLNGWGLRANSDGTIQVGRQTISPDANPTITFPDNMSAKTDALAPGSWNHIAISTSGSNGAGNFTLYINGVEVLTSTGFGLNGSKFGKLRLGWDGLSGEIAGFTVDDTVLDANAIQAIMDSSNPVPEPATATLGLFGLASLLLRRRRA